METRAVILGTILIFLCCGLDARSGTLDLFGAPSELFCPDLLSPDASVDERLFTAYARVLESYRDTVSPDEYDEILSSLLANQTYYSLPRRNTAARSVADLVARIEVAVDKQADRKAVDERIRAHLEAQVKKAASTVRTVEKATKKTAKAQKISRPLEPAKFDLNVLAVDPNFQWALAGGREARREGKLILWDMKTRKRIRTFDAHNGSIFRIRVSADLTRAVSVSYDGTLAIWNLKKLKRAAGWSGIQKMGGDLQVSADFTRVIAASDNNTLALWDLNTLERLRVLKGHKDAVIRIVVNDDFTKALSTSVDLTMILWDLTTGKKIRVLKGNARTPFALRVSKDFKWAISGNDDKKVIFWDLETGEGQVLSRRSGNHKVVVKDIQVNEDFTRAISISYDGTIIVWDLETRKPIHHLRDEQGLENIRVSKDFKWAIAGGPHLNIWNLETETLVARISESSPITDIAVDEEFKQAVVICRDGEASVLDLKWLNGETP